MKLLNGFSVAPPEGVVLVPLTRNVKLKSFALRTTLKVILKINDDPFVIFASVVVLYIRSMTISPSVVSFTPTEELTNHTNPAGYMTRSDRFVRLSASVAVETFSKKVMFLLTLTSDPAGWNCWIFTCRLSARATTEKIASTARAA